MKGRKPQHIRIERDPLAHETPPDWLCEDAKHEWRRVAPILSQRRILTDADLGMLENYCMAMGTVREMEREIQSTGAVMKVYKLDKGGTARVISVRKNPAVSVQSDAMTRARLLAAELGCTPVSRARPSVEDNGDEDDLFGWGGDAAS